MATETASQRICRIAREEQIARIRAVHGNMGDEWGGTYHKVINALEAALSAMDEAHDDIATLNAEGAESW